MFKGFVLRYLAQLATGSTEADGEGSLPTLLRPIVMPLVRKRVVSAGFETEHADDLPHVHRVAYLQTLGRPAQNPNEPVRVQQEFSAMRNEPLENKAGLRIGIPLLLLTVCVIVGGWFFRNQATPEVALEPAEEEVKDTSRDIVVVEQHPLRSVFHTRIPEHSIALDALSRKRPKAPPFDAKSTLEDALEPLAGSPKLQTATKELMEAAREYIDGKSAKNWDPKLVQLHQALEDADVPFHLDAHLTSNLRTGRQRVLMSTYDVQNRRLFKAGEYTIKSLELTRLDRLNHVRSLLGYTRPEIRYAIVLVDRIERFLVDNVLPSIHSAQESVIVRDFHEEKNANWVTDFEAWAHEDLKSDAKHILSQAKVTQPEALTDLADAIVNRRTALRAINQSLRHRNVKLRSPRSYTYDPGELDHLMRDIDSSALQSLRKAEDALQTPAVLEAWKALLAATVESVSKHEVQHRLDYEDDRLTHVPETLEAYTGKTESEDQVNRRAEGANAELSAYLSQVAQTPLRSRATLIQILSFVMDPKSWGTRESYAAIALFEALARAAEIPHGDLVEDRRIVRASFAEIYGAIRQRQDVAEIAQTAWEKLYRSKLRAIEAP